MTKCDNCGYELPSNHIKCICGSYCNQTCMEKSHNEARARDMAMDKHNLWNKGKKAELWVCGPIPAPHSMKAKCYKCKKEVYYDPSVKKFIKKGCRKICIPCALKSETLNQEQKFILKRAMIGMENL